jgi:hypothetical protein
MGQTAIERAHQRRGSRWSGMPVSVNVPRSPKGAPTLDSVKDRLDRRSLVAASRWSPLAAFPQAAALCDRVFSLGNGCYALTNPSRGDGNPVRAVGWAESDYWAARAWANPPYNGTLDPPPPQWQPVPSLAFRGRPEVLCFKKVVDFETLRSGPKAILVDARYRLTDGAFLFFGVNGSDGLTYIFGSHDPSPEDEPVALEFRLPGPAIPNPSIRRSSMYDPQLTPGPKVAGQ